MPKKPSVSRCWFSSLIGQAYCLCDYNTYGKTDFLDYEIYFKNAHLNALLHWKFKREVKS